jgi:hypothetical protein
MEQSMEFQRLPSGAKVVISAIWEISDAPRGSVACVHSRWKVGTLAVRCGMHPKHLHRWLVRIDARRRRQHEAAGRGTPAGYLGDWIETRCHLGRYLSCTAFASLSIESVDQSNDESDTKFSSSPETLPVDPDTTDEVEGTVAPALPQVSRRRDSRCSAGATSYSPPSQSTRGSLCEAEREPPTPPPQRAREAPPPATMALTVSTSVEGGVVVGGVASGAPLLAPEGGEQQFAPGVLPAGFVEVSDLLRAVGVTERFVQALAGRVLALPDGLERLRSTVQRLRDAACRGKCQSVPAALRSLIDRGTLDPVQNAAQAKPAPSRSIPASSRPATGPAGGPTRAHWSRFGSVRTLGDWVDQCRNWSGRVEIAGGAVKLPALLMPDAGERLVEAAKATLPDRLRDFMLRLEDAIGATMPEGVEVPRMDAGRDAIGDSRYDDPESALYWWVRAAPLDRWESTLPIWNHEKVMGSDQFNPRLGQPAPTARPRLAREFC